ncbi:trypsin-like peptidase domain-containing protein [uncultured Cohaesibacter sp.]|uniref:S1 family peptidase n=1 Tax=uncultured Cohaesibacter sp. TaxID=1002546 RepID=UPI00292CADB0|nr:trypsin-like peptidase domain-containing protein [uncultured Cohaesibacter sp.]
MGVEILKTVFRKSNSGVWSIEAIKGLNLKAKRGFESNYFKIEPEVDVMTENPSRIMDSFFTSFGTTDFFLRQSIVPIVAWNEGDDEIRCIGTGFFISASGLLMTAAHVIRDPVDEKYAELTEISNNSAMLGNNLHVCVMLPANPAIKTAPFRIAKELGEAEYFLCPIVWTTHWGKEVCGPLFHLPPEFKLDLDIAICKVREFPAIGPYQPLNIGPHSLRVGDQAVAIGYPEMQNLRIGGKERYRPELMVSVGTVTAIYPDNMTEKQNNTPGPNFEFSAKIPGKMSGSPILVSGGVVTKGVVSRSLQGENHASGGLIAPMLQLPIFDGKSLTDLTNEGKEGIPQIYGSEL